MGLEGDRDIGDGCDTLALTRTFEEFAGINAISRTKILFFLSLALNWNGRKLEFPVLTVNKDLKTGIEEKHKRSSNEECDY